MHKTMQRFDPLLRALNTDTGRMDTRSLPSTARSFRQYPGQINQCMAHISGWKHGIRFTNFAAKKVPFNKHTQLYIPPPLEQQADDRAVPFDDGPVYKLQQFTTGSINKTSILTIR